MFIYININIILVYPNMECVLLDQLSMASSPPEAAATVSDVTSNLRTVVSRTAVVPRLY